MLVDTSSNNSINHGRCSTRDRTIIQFSFFACLRAKEKAALKIGDVYDDEGNVREQFVLTAAQSKGHKAHAVWINSRLCVNGFSANTMTQLFLDIYKAADFAHASSRSLIANLAAKFVSVRGLAELAGHSSIQTTRRYIAVSPQQMMKLL